MGTWPTPAGIREQLERILASPGFAGSQRLGRFLRFVVEKTLAGEAGEVKESVLAVEVFDRRPDYDSRIDSVVRVEARRLRSKLRTYYEREGKRDPVVIEIPEGAYLPRWRSAGEESRRASVAVLPFANLSADPAQEFFCDGVTEEIIGLLSRIPSLRVVARTSVFQFRNAASDVREIGARLGAAVVVEGSVRSAPDRIRIAARVVDADTGYQLAAKTFDGSLQDVFAMQERVAASVAEAVSATLHLPSLHSPSANFEAYSLYLKGRHHWNLQTIDGFRTAARVFEEAIARFPTYAPAFAGLADTCCMLATYGAVNPAEAAPRIRDASARAIALDPRLAEPYNALAGLQSFFEWNWNEAAENFRRALELRPAFAMARHWYGMHLAARGRLEEAEAELEEAAVLDPLSLDILTSHAILAYYRQDFAAAGRRIAAVLELDPAFPAAWDALARVKLLERRYEEALDCAGKAAGHAAAALNLALTGAILARGGNGKKARRILAELVRQAEASHVPALAPAMIHTALGETPAALDWLERAFRERTILLCWVGIDPFYHPLAAEPRFRALLLRMGLAPG
jgi:serine/threonine-protein kinase